MRCDADAMPKRRPQLLCRAAPRASRVLTATRLGSYVCRVVTNDNTHLHQSALLSSSLLSFTSRLFSFTSPSRLVSSPSLLVSSASRVCGAAEEQRGAERSSSASASLSLFSS